MPSSSEPGGQRAAPMGRSGPGSFPGRRSPLSGGLLSGMSGSPRGLGTLTATEAATGLSDFHVRSWRDPMPPRGRLLRARCCPGPGPARVCRASGDGTLVRVRLRPAAPASGGPGPFLPCGQQRSPRAGHRRSDRLASRASFPANPDLTMRVQGGPESGQMRLSPLSIRHQWEAFAAGAPPPAPLTSLRSMRGSRARGVSGTAEQGRCGLAPGSATRGPGRFLP